MGASLQSGPSGGGHKRRGARFRPMAEINVTPFVDVMLVLLIVFMVSAPLLTVGEPVDLPNTDSSALEAPQDPLVVTVRNDCALFLQETEIAIDALREQLRTIREVNQEGGDPADVGRVLIRADAEAPFECVIAALAEVRQAGLNAGFVTEPLRSE